MLFIDKEISIQGRHISEIKWAQTKILPFRHDCTLKRMKEYLAWQNSLLRLATAERDLVDTDAEENVEKVVKPESYRSKLWK